MSPGSCCEIQEPCAARVISPPIRLRVCCTLSGSYSVSCLSILLHDKVYYQYAILASEKCITSQQEILTALPPAFPRSCRHILVYSAENAGGDQALEGRLPGSVQARIVPRNRAEGRKGALQNCTEKRRTETLKKVPVRLFCSMKGQKGRFRTLHFPRFRAISSHRFCCSSVSMIRPGTSAGRSFSSSATITK